MRGAWSARRSREHARVAHTARRGTATASRTLRAPQVRHGPDAQRAHVAVHGVVHRAARQPQRSQVVPGELAQHAAPHVAGQLQPVAHVCGVLQDVGGRPDAPDDGVGAGVVGANLQVRPHPAQHRAACRVLCVLRAVTLPQPDAAAASLTVHCCSTAVPSPLLCRHHCAILPLSQAPGWRSRRVRATRAAAAAVPQGGVACCHHARITAGTRLCWHSTRAPCLPEAH